MTARPPWRYNRHDQYAAIEFDGDSRRVHQVVAGFAYAYAAELYARHQAWSDYTIGPVAVVTPTAAP